MSVGQGFGFDLNVSPFCSESVSIGKESIVRGIVLSIGIGRVVSQSMRGGGSTALSPNGGSFPMVACDSLSFVRWFSGRPIRSLRERLGMGACLLEPLPSRSSLYGDAPSLSLMMDRKLVLAQCSIRLTRQAVEQQSKESERREISLPDRAMSLSLALLLPLSPSQSMGEAVIVESRSCAVMGIPVDSDGKDDKGNNNANDSNLGITSDLQLSALRLERLAGRT
mmetsp:Transcript_998/g.2784  ORF Transcript_998/g.2784 Transcript_998/m.2784 type:complete len:224 (-) Transcript_998:78-749(-)